MIFFFLKMRPDRFLFHYMQFTGEAPVEHSPFFIEDNGIHITSAAVAVTILTFIVDNNIKNKMSALSELKQE